MTTMNSGPMPVLFLSHGAPPLADHTTWPTELAQWALKLPHPSAILIISAHWESAPMSLGAVTTQPLIYDFQGFPERYYRVSYPAPGAPELARAVHALLDGPGMTVARQHERGLDHGAYVPLKEMYPEADTPVLQLSMPSLQPQTLLGIGRKLAPLREEGVLIIGSGFFTHNLHAMTPDDQKPYSFTSEFDDWGREMLAGQNLDALLDFEHKAPAAKLAHPRADHFAPLFISLGAGENDLPSLRTTIDGYWLGLARRSIQIG